MSQLDGKTPHFLSLYLQTHTNPGLAYPRLAHPRLTHCHLTSSYNGSCDVNHCQFPPTLDSQGEIIFAGTCIERVCNIDYGSWNQWGWVVWHTVSFTRLRAWHLHRVPDSAWLILTSASSRNFKVITIERPYWNAEWPSKCLMAAYPSISLKSFKH